MLKLKKLENFHIVLWLVKDTCWLLHCTIGGVIMIVPTVAMAIYLSYKTRNTITDFLPNLAVCFWIGANGIWMLGEFFDFNHIPFALSSFLIGIVLIAYYFAKFSHSLEIIDEK